MATKKDKSEEIDIENELDALFKLPLADFTIARNTLAARLKKTVHRDEAERVKSIPKPSTSAWVVNQLYWKYRDAFDRLTATAKRFGRAQHAHKSEDMREALAERRDVLSDLTRDAGALLRDAGHNPNPDTMRRITTTLEALSTGSPSIDARPGRLTADIAPPGFESLAGFAPTTARVIPFKSDLRQTKIVAAKAAVESAERALQETQSMAQDVVADLKEATAHADEMEKKRRDAEERFEEARTAATEARERLRKATGEATKAARLLENAERALAKAREDAADILPS